MTLAQHYSSARFLTKLLDSQFEILGVRFGLDPLIGLIPALGNLVTTGASVYVFWIAARLHVPMHVYFKMFLNIVLDAALTSVPVLGNIFDIFHRANEKNLQLLSGYFPDNILTGKVLGK